MKKLQSLTSLLLLLLWLVPTSTVTMSFSDDDTALTIVANEKGAPSSMTLKELKLVIQGDKQRWPDGNRISLAFMKTSTPTGAATAKKLLNMTGDQFNKHWLALVFQGKAKAPAFFTSVGELEGYINSTPGAIGVIETSANSKSRVVVIDDKKSL